MNLNRLKSSNLGKATEQRPRCQHGNLISKDKTAPCFCMLIDGIIHPCRGCHHTCGNCL